MSSVLTRPCEFNFSNRLEPCVWKMFEQGQKRVKRNIRGRQSPSPSSQHLPISPWFGRMDGDGTMTQGPCVRSQTIKSHNPNEQRTLASSCSPREGNQNQNNCGRKLSPCLSQVFAGGGVDIHRAAPGEGGCEHSLAACKFSAVSELWGEGFAGHTRTKNCLLFLWAH